MTEPITFTSQSPNFELPLLFAGQAQKEFFYNEAQLIIDALLHLSVEGTISTPPTEVEDGECWIVGTNAQSDWAGREQAVAVRHAGVKPRPIYQPEVRQSIMKLEPASNR